MMIPYKGTQKRYNLPEKILFCKTCTISNQRPRISFDEKGICSACNYAKVKEKINWKERESLLWDLCNKFRKSNGEYDVIVPSSGGKDSAFTAHLLKNKYKMNPLTVTWSPHLWTEVGFQNFQSHIHIGSLDNVLGTPNGKIHRQLTKLSLEIIGDPFQPFIYGQSNFPLQIAVQRKIPFIMYGENGEVEYGGHLKNANSPTRDYKTDHKVHYFSGIMPEQLEQYGVNKKDLIPYMMPPLELLDQIKTEIHFMGYYHRWIPQENYYYAVENTGFKPKNGRSEQTYSRYASLDDQLDGFHYYLAYIKFGLGRATSDTAHEIRDGHITRDEGVALVKRFDHEFPKGYFQTFLDYCDIEKSYFFEVVDSWRSPHLWKKENGEWVLRHPIWEHE